MIFTGSLRNHVIWHISWCKSMNGCCKMIEANFMEGYFVGDIYLNLETIWDVL